MQHYFNVEIATSYGLNCAILLDNILFWCEKNKANKKNFYDGFYWTYNSNEAFSKLFPYMTPKVIRTSLDKLILEGLLLKGNYNQNQYDRTAWYAVTLKTLILYHIVDPEDYTEKNSVEPHKSSFALQGKCIRPTGQMDLPQEKNAFASEGRPIPYNKQDITTDKKQSTYPAAKMDEDEMDIAGDPASAFLEYQNLIKKNFRYEDYILENPGAKDKVDEIIDLMAEIISIPQDKVRINQKNYPYSVVKAQLLKLDDSHLDYVLKSLTKASQNNEIKNIRSYLLTCLFNSKNSANIGLSCEIQHDLQSYRQKNNSMDVLQNEKDELDYDELAMQRFQARLKGTR